MAPVSCCGIWPRSRREDNSSHPVRDTDSEPQHTSHVRLVIIRPQSARSVSVPRSHASIPSPPPVCGTEDPGNVTLNSVENSPGQPTTQMTDDANARPDLWEKAKATLSGEDRAWVNETVGTSLTPVHDIVDKMIILATEKQRECETSGWKTVRLGNHTIALEEVTSNIIIWLNKFKEVGDTLVQYDPVHAALPWAAVRFILQAAISTKERMAASLAVLEKATRIIHRCQVFEEVYNRTNVDHVVVKDLESSLVQLYGRVLHGLIKAHQFLSRSTPLKVISVVFQPAAGSDLLASLESGEAQVDQAVIACESHRKAKNDARFESQLNGLLKLNVPVLRIDKNIEKVLQQLESEKLTRILTWISPIKFQLHHNIVSELRTKGTCDWLLQCSKFGQWSSATSSMTLWLQGFPGSGKTFLTSRVIEEIETTLGGKDNDECFAFFYCNRNEENRRHALDVLRSYVRQLSTTSHKPGFIYLELEQLHHKCESRGSGWTLGLCKEYLIKLLNLYPRATLVLDALDECWPEERADLLDFFDSIPSKSSKPVRIFISSRPESDLRQRLIHLPNIGIEATDNGDDIAKFVRTSIERNGNWSRVLRQNEHLKDDIVQTLLTQSNGMFQWAMLQIKQLLNLGTEGEIRSRLGKLPKSLKAAYDEIFENIECLEADARTMSFAAFRWVMCAYEPLTSEALLAAININPEKETVGSVETADDDLLGWTGHLLRIDTQHNPPAWRVSHLSVVEYLETHWTILEAHCYVAKASLVLLRETFRDEAEQQLSTSLEIFHPGYELQEYIQFNWIRHVQTQEDQDIDPKLAYLLKAFLGSLEESSVHYRGWRRRIISETIIEDQKVIHRISLIDILMSFSRSSTTPLACCFSLYNLIRDWWDNTSLESLPKRIEDGDNLLTIAAAAGSKPICLRLCELGMPVNTACESETSPLSAAARNGHADIVRFLVDKGADIHRPLQDDYRSVLEVAISRGHIDIVRFLVDKGANINQPLQAHYCSALAAAAERGQIDMVRYLVDKEANINQLLNGYFYNSALAAAAHYGHLDVVRFLVGRGAFVNMPSQTRVDTSALYVAAKWGYLEVVQFLVDKGAILNVPRQGGGDICLALGAARRERRHSVVAFLISKGAIE
ncbi:hypothetical protein F5B22DRAFT_648539 [Xylaria bambusicola]|uniref:uncharacterized protein n=1 Tax=Xylaria bambusicola TaxID=326684 RepID=UPI0020076801|nr:uncharacterized protein F5B22DRAFT_648539 [Xylaria bambusicola]KAI0512690.1 hypothetical protein F5B22DRAFT_648539 [Xylaria bambusicola]